MPPAPPIKSIRPSVYANNTGSSSTKKRASVSPAEAAGGYHHHHHPGKLAGLAPKREISPNKQRFQQVQQQQVQRATVTSASAPIINHSVSNPIMRSTGITMSSGSSNGNIRENRLLFEDEYSREVQDYMHEMEEQTLASADFIDMQPELQWYMRPYLVDFLVEIHQQFRLRPEVLYLALNIVDRYVSKRVVYKKHYQLVGCSALWIASKFEDAKDRVPTVKELADMCCSAYDVTAFLQMEGHLLQTIGWTIGHPTAEAWMRLYCQGTQESTRVQHVARFIMETTLFARDFVGLKPSTIAQGCLLMARHICGFPVRTDLLPHDKEVKHVTTCLDVLFSEHAKSVSQICIEKYAPHYYSTASTVTMQYYASGRRYRLAELPITPAATLSSSLVSAWSRRASEYSNGSPGIYSTSSSECGDETLPKTPCTPIGTIGGIDPFVVQAMSAGSSSGHEVPIGMLNNSSSKENIMPAGYDVLGPKKSINPNNAHSGGYAINQQQRVVLQSVQPQVHNSARLRRLSS